MIKGVIFDIDGVVLDSMSIWNDLGARYLISRGIEPEEGLNEILFSMSMEQGAEYAKEHYRLNESVEDILDGIRLMSGISTSAIVLILWAHLKCLSLFIY